MKKRALIIILAVIVITLFFKVRLTNGAKTMEEALSPHGSKEIHIIHEEKTDKGSIVFYNHIGKNDLSTAFMKKYIGRYKVIYSGVQGDIKTVLSKFDMTYEYFPGIEKTSLPIYFGIIGNPDISQIKVVEKKRNIEGHAKIIDAEGTRIWLLYMSTFEGSEFEIIGLSTDDRELIRISDNISPYYAEQKPFKSPY